MWEMAQSTTYYSHHHLYNKYDAGEHFLIALDYSTAVHKDHSTQSLHTSKSNIGSGGGKTSPAASGLHHFTQSSPKCKTNNNIKHCH